MLPTYQGLLRLDHIEWDREAPPLPDGHPVRVLVTLLDPVAVQADRGQRMADALTRLAALRTGNLPEDATAWQRETREDGALPE
jgi:uncharacterized membrane protein